MGMENSALGGVVKWVVGKTFSCPAAYLFGNLNCFTHLPMKPFLSLCLVLVTTLAFAGKAAVTDIKAALDQAKAENKMLFLQYGREACGNCQALKAMIKSKKVQLSDSKFVYADVNCDDSATKKVFASHFKVSGNTLPFVVIASPDGKQLASHGGYGTEAEFNKLIKEASKAAKE
jgi:thioredoxin-related protein